MPGRGSLHVGPCSSLRQGPAFATTSCKTLSLLLLAGPVPWREASRRHRNPIVQAQATMRFIGHRGASHVAPENTLNAAELALAAGAGFEIDLQVVKSGEIIVLHDSTLWRTATGTGWFLTLLSYIFPDSNSGHTLLLVLLANIHLC